MKKSYFFLVLLLAVLTSCSKKQDFLLSPVVPAANGNVQVDTGKDLKYNIKVIINNLAEAHRVNPNKRTYVVWAESNNREIKNIGQIHCSKKFLSGGLRASLETELINKPSRIFITAEENANVATPNTETVMSTAIF